MPGFGAIEAGGTKFLCGVGTGPEDLITTQIRTGSPESTIAAAVAWIREKAGGELSAVGIGSFGPVDLKTGHITSTPKAEWRNFDLAGEVRRALGVPVAFDTDVNAAVLGEARWGAARGVANCIYLTIGTGIGGGAIVEGNIVHGLTHPEMGHIRVPREASDTFAGVCPYHGDCLEGLATGPAVEARWGGRGRGSAGGPSGVGARGAISGNRNRKLHLHGFAGEDYRRRRRDATGAVVRNDSCGRRANTGRVYRKAAGDCAAGTGRVVGRAGRAGARGERGVTDDGILRRSGTQQARLIREGALSSVELVSAHLKRIDEVNPKLNAVVEILREPALDAAKEVDRRHAAGETMRPLEGVPFSVKDSIEVEGTVCSAGTVGFQNRAKSKKDATLVARLRDAGAIPTARTNLPDLLFAFESDNLIFGRTNNPYDLTRTCGGSSGGEAALIAACGSPFGLGSDAAGSVRQPAHFCGIASLKPTSGRLARTGHVPAAGGWLEMVWQIGPMARRVEDLWTMMPILLGLDGMDRTVVPMPYGDPAEVPLRDLRVAYFTDNGIVKPDEETCAVVEAAAKALASEVRSVEESRPAGIDESYDLEMKIIGPDGGDGLRAYLKDIGSTRIHPLLESWLRKLEPYRTDVAGFADYWASLDKFRDSMHAFGNRFDAVISPVASQPAVAHGRSIEDEVFRGFSYTMTHNLCGWPAVVVRCGTTKTGLPIGVQIAANPWREDVALAIARVLEMDSYQEPGLIQV